MNEDEKIPSTKKEIAGTDETNSTKEETTESYEVGYRKPPKNTRFRKGFSGNLAGRPKRAPDFDAALLREAKSRITIIENGRRIRVSKHDIIVKQFTNNAMKGKGSDLRMFREAYRQACEKDALLEAQRTKDLERHNDLENLTIEELERLYTDVLKAEEKAKKK
jgi:Family of unknown function (DUF5681)